jgi:hypothetical protein
MTAAKKNPDENPTLLTEEELRNRVFGTGPHQAETVSEEMQRDQRSANRINAWVHRFSRRPKEGGASD